MKGGRQMNFASALFSLKRGFKIKRHDWIGYWVLENNKVMMHLKNGTVKNLADSEDIIFTLENMACDDWEVITDASNVGLPKCPSDTITMPPHPEIHLTEDKKTSPITINPIYTQKPRWWEDLKVETGFNTSCGKMTVGSSTKAQENSFKVEDLDSALKMADDHCKVIGNIYDSHTSVNDNGIYAPTNDQPVNDEGIYESVSNEHVNDNGIYERSDSKGIQLHDVTTIMNAVIANPDFREYKEESCKSDGFKQIPADSKDASNMQRLHEIIDSAMK